MLVGLTSKLAWPDIAALANACGAACCELVGAAPDPGHSRARIVELYTGPPVAGLAQAQEAAAPEHEAPPVHSEAVDTYLRTVVAELSNLRADFDTDRLAKASELVIAREHDGARVHVTGTGKCEHVARYGASLLSSTGTPAYFLHATEACHGSAGQVRKGDVVVAISNSGTTKETLAAVTALRATGARIIGITRSAQSPLGMAAELVLETGEIAEGGPLGLAPRGSVVAHIYVLGALSVALQDAKAVSRELYNSWHPDGELGQRSSATEHDD